MTTSIASAMRVLEKGDVAAAEGAFASVAGSKRDRVIARFRRAECLSRLGRHDEAIGEARVALADGPRESAPWVWLVHCLAEAGRFDEAVAVPIPAQHAEELTVLRDGYAALAKVAAAGPLDPTAVDAVLPTHHAPLYSLALRHAESARLARAPRWPDVPSVWYAHECEMERKADRVVEHPAPPMDASAPKAIRWLRLHWSCADYAALVAKLRAAPKPPDGLDECEMEQHLAFGRLDAAAALGERLAREAGKDAAGELCLLLTRAAHLRGEPAAPSQYAGFDDARLRLAPSIAWLDLCVELMNGRSLAARTIADRVADPSHREYVEAALRRRMRAT
jgi:hypothetical protein